MGCWYSLDNGLLGYLILITLAKKKKNKSSRKEVCLALFLLPYSPLVLAKFCSDCCLLTWEHEELLVRELSLVLVSFVEREKKIAGSQVTVNLLLVCSGYGKNIHLQCLIRC